MTMSGWKVRRGIRWWEVRVWTPPLVRWVFCLRLFPPKVQAQRVLTDRELRRLLEDA